MAEIARRAGVVRATIYAHFPTREALLDAVMEHAVGQVARGNAASRAGPRRARGSAGASAPGDLAELGRFHTILEINKSRLSDEELTGVTCR